MIEFPSRPRATFSFRDLKIGDTGIIDSHPYGTVLIGRAFIKTKCGMVLLSDGSVVGLHEDYIVRKVDFRLIITNEYI